MDPVTIGALASGAMKLLSSPAAQGPSASPDGPISAAAGGMSFDSSGWTVSTGKSTASATAGDRSAVPASGFLQAVGGNTLGTTLAAPIGGLDPHVLLIAGALIVGALCLRKGR